MSEFVPRVPALAHTGSPTGEPAKIESLVAAPVFKAISGTAIDHEGSAVLVGSNTRWLFTAGHVLGQHQALFLAGRKWVRLPRDRFGISPESLDLAYARLSTDEAGAIVAGNPKAKFLPWECVDASVEPLSPEMNGCAITGFPMRSVEIDGDAQTIQISATVITSQFLAPRELIQARIDDGSHIAAKFGGLKDWGGRIKGFDPHGLSGSAIWKRNADGKNYLVGIATEYDPARKIIIGSRIRPMVIEIAEQLRENLS